MSCILGTTRHEDITAGGLWPRAARRSLGCLAAGRGARLSPATAVAWLPLSFPLERGGTLVGGQLAYELIGPAGAPLVAVQGGISATRHVAAHARDPRPGWWDALVGPGHAVDTRRFRVLAFDWLGGDGASTGPREGGGGTFPDVTTADQAEALAVLLDQLGVARLHASVGASFGGMVALAFAARHPGRVRRTVVIGAADRPDPLATAWRAVQRRIVALGLRAGCATDALALARALAMTTYRGRDELAARFSSDPLRIDAYLAARGAAFAASFDAEAFLVLSRAIDLHRVDPRAVRARVTLVAFRSDLLVPVQQVRALAAALWGPCELVELDSPYGHDAFLKEAGLLEPVLRGALEGGGR